MRRKLGEQGLVPGYACLLPTMCIGGSRGRLQCFVLRLDLVNVDQVAVQPSQPSVSCALMYPVGGVVLPGGLDAQDPGLNTGQEGYILGRACHHLLQSLNLSLNLLRIFLPVHMLLFEAAVVHAGRIVK